MPGLTIETPGKINLHLRVKQRRSDGYHELESIFLALRFGDTLHFSLCDEPGLRGLRGFTALAPEENIICRALSLFRAETGFSRGLRVELEKRIPLGGGMGGGSSDAASTLLALNELSGAGLSAPRLAELAGKLGSDVPFFLVGGAAWVSGRGELIQPVPSPAGLPVVLVNPGFPSETAGAFRLLDASREASVFSGAEFAPELPPEVLIKALEGHPGGWPFYNDFLPVLSAGAGGVYQRMLSGLKEGGADFCGLSGAGSTCFGVFPNRKLAEKAVKSLTQEWPFVELTFPLAYRVNPVLK
ncbi:MAG: 4-(cytidine 5'-diphospho)-2-C-methyl-D-erythritol kinase [Treponema sp.]|jgi:4-diphosphocytidyl-2-C-methyl-D-erythritol kinase|nr:4-(cytidine 5'-diphospho)-2-C-methyl-D-erythritol kinase [Treponema sp.]